MPTVRQANTINGAAVSMLATPRQTPASTMPIAVLRRAAHRIRATSNRASCVGSVTKVAVPFRSDRGRAAAHSEGGLLMRHRGKKISHSVISSAVTVAGLVGSMASAVVPGFVVVVLTRPRTALRPAMLARPAGHAPSRQPAAVPPDYRSTAVKPSTWRTTASRSRCRLAVPTGRPLPKRAGRTRQLAVSTT